MVDKNQIERGKKIHDILVKASKDPSFKKELKTNPQSVFEKANVNIYQDCYLKILENSNFDFHITIPAKKYPRDMELQTLPKGANLDEIIRWIVTQIQSNSSLKEQILNNAETVLKQQGAKIPEDMKIHIHQNSDKIRYFVIPRDSKEDEELSELELQAIAGGSQAIYAPGKTNFTNNTTSTTTSITTTTNAEPGSTGKTTTTSNSSMNGSSLTAMIYNLLG